MTPNDAQLCVDSIDHYLPKDGCTNCGRSFYINGYPESVFVHADGFRHGSCDDRWDTAAPERVWVPAPELPRVFVRWRSVAMKAMLDTDQDVTRPLAVGDRVSLVTDCPNTGSWYHDEAGEPCEHSCGNGNVVRVGSATVTEIVPVEHGAHEVYDKRCIQHDGHLAWLWYWTEKHGGCWLRESGTLHDQRRDWSTACFGVRLTDVEVTSRMMESRWPLKPGTLTHDPADVSPVEDER